MPVLEGASIGSNAEAKLLRPVSAGGKWTQAAGRMQESSLTYKYLPNYLLPTTVLVLSNHTSTSTSTLRLEAQEMAGLKL